MIVGELRLAIAARDLCFIRDQFRALVGYPNKDDIEAENADQLVEALDLCMNALVSDTATMPRDACAALDLPLGASYADGTAWARVRRAQLHAQFYAALPGKRRTAPEPIADGSLIADHLLVLCRSYEQASSDLAEGGSSRVVDAASDKIDEILATLTKNPPAPTTTSGAVAALRLAINGHCDLIEPLVGVVIKFLEREQAAVVAAPPLQAEG